MEDLIYLDHAATSWPKPPGVIPAMVDYLERAGGNPGRSGHRLSVAAGRIVYEAREAVADLVHAPDPLAVVFAHNATHALNLALHGLLRPGHRVVTGGMEHNSVMRPLRALERQGVSVTVVPASPEGKLDPGAFADAITPATRLVVVNHASNVVGTIAPVAEIARVAHAAGALLLVDAAQTAGVLPIDVMAMGIDLLAFTGHKGLQGPPGTGGLVLCKRSGPAGNAAQLDGMIPHLQGGTGSRSQMEEQPNMLPDKFEPGTANGAGVAGLAAGLRWIRGRGLDTLRGHEVELTAMLIEGLGNVPGVSIYGPTEADERTAVISIRVAGRTVSEVGQRLDEEHGVLCRVGLHCAPAAHRSLGTFPEGTVRLAMGPMTTADQVRAAIRAVAHVAQA